MQVSVPLTVSVDVGTPPPALAAQQKTRLAKAALVGPLMVYCGAKAGGLAGFALTVLGVGTVYKNGRDYLAGRHVVSAAPLPVPPAAQNLPGAPPST